MMHFGLIFLGICLVLAALIVMSVRIYQAQPSFVIKILKYGIIGIFWIIFSALSIGIGFRIDQRHDTTYSRNFKSVSDIWGGTIIQDPPDLYFETKELEEFENSKTGKMETRFKRVSKNISFESQVLKVDIESKIRKKGLLEFPGYKLHFKVEYILKNTLPNAEKINFLLALPYNAGNITDVQVFLDGTKYTGDTNLADGVNWEGYMGPNEEKKISVEYKAQGTGVFQYSLGKYQKEIKKLEAVLTTNFTDYDIPEYAMVPSNINSDGTKTEIKWEGKNLITGQNISLKFDIEGNYGKVASKLFFYSPLALFLFLGSILLFTISRQINLHPMHYLFLIGGFFVFYLLGSYLISYIKMIPGILVSLAISMGIMLYYVYLIKKEQNLIQVTLVASLIFQWIFSLAFFFPEHTGFIITLGSIIAFVALLKSTAQVDWENKF
ncbi:MAG: US12 family protein [Leptospiraceae bacterium]|nr:US12 family protein [Leptospiraceae bacterium]MCP5496439.1 US12 family protein [Leptospiraceae bacterium]